MNTLNLLTEQTYALTGLHCGSCVRKIEQALQPFADEVKVTLDPMQARLTHLHDGASLQALQTAVAGLGNYTLEELKQNQPLAGVESAQGAMKSGVISNVSELSWLQTYRPLLLIVAFILGASVLVQLGQHAGHGIGLAAITGMETMRYFMAGFFLVFAFFKLLDLRAFADAYAGYDLLAARWYGWGYVYPFVELGLGMAYLAHWQPTLTAWVTLIVMGFSAIGVIRAVMSKTKIRCACLGTVFQLPMSTVTIVEDVGMVLMAAAMLALT
jgi:copper chaperone CopZ